MFTRSQLKKRERSKTMRKLRNIVHNNVPKNFKFMYLPISAKNAKRVLGVFRHQMMLLNMPVTPVKKEKKRKVLPFFEKNNVIA